MSYQIPYEGASFTPDDDLIPGNAAADDPVRFELVPAGGSDLARLKSVMYAAAGLTNEGTWSPDMQQAVISSFDSGAAVFERCVLSVRGLTVPAALAVRVGLLATIPVRADSAGQVRPDPDAPVPITTGPQFTRIVPFQTALALALCFEIMKISRQIERLDVRLFAEPSGSPSPGIPVVQNGPVRRARKGPGRRETVA